MENIEECTRMRSILSALGPIAKKIVELKETRFGAHCDASVILYLLKQCQSLELACKHLMDYLTQEAKRLGDKQWPTEIGTFNNNLIKTVKRLEDSTRDLHRGDVEVKENEDVWRSIIFYSEELLEGLIKMLLSWDRAQQRKINSSLDKFIHTVHGLKDVPFDCLIKPFQGVVQNAIEMFLLVEERRTDICRKSQRETIAICCMQLRRLLEILSVITAESCRNRLCKGVTAARDYVQNKVDDLVQSLRKEMALGSSQYDLQESGKYINTLNELFDAFTVHSGVKIVEKIPVLESIKVSLETVLQHCICVAQCVSTSDHSTIMSACEDVLHQMKLLSKLENLECPDPNDVAVQFDVIVDVLELLEVQVNSSLIKLIVQIFTQPFSTLETILKEVNAVNSEEIDVNLSSDTKKIEDLVEKFEDEVDRYYQIGGFVIACINDLSKVRQIESTLNLLSWLENGLLTAILKVGKRHALAPHSLFEVRFLAEEWMKEVSTLRNIIYSLTEPDALIYVTNQEILKIFMNVRQQLQSESLENSFGCLKRNVEKVICLIQRILSTNQHCLFLEDNNIKELELGLNEISLLYNQIEKDGMSKLATQSFTQRLKCVLTTFTKISVAYSERSAVSYEKDLPLFSPKPEFNGYASATMKSTGDSIIVSNISRIPFDVSGTPIDQTLKSLSCENGKSDDALAEDEKKLQSIFRNNLSSRRKSREKLNLLKGSRPDVYHVMQAKMDESDRKDISIDITKFLLSRSSNTFRNSTRASKRNFLLKVKEIDLDIGEVVKITPKANVPKYISPLYIEDTFDDFTEIIHKLERFTSTSSTGSTDIERETKTQSFTARKEPRQCPKNNLFYHSIHPKLPENSEQKISCEISSLRKVFNENQTNYQLVSTAKVSTNAKSHDKENVLNVTQESHRDLTFVTAGTPSSLNIGTPQRINDLKTADYKLEILRL